MAELLARQRIIGVLVYQPQDEAPDGRPAFVVSAVGVVSDQRRKGVATNLKITAMANVATEHGTNLLSEVHRANEPMLRLNAKLGVRISEELLPGTEYRATAIMVKVPWYRRIVRPRSSGLER